MSPGNYCNCKPADSSDIRSCPPSLPEVPPGDVAAWKRMAREGVPGLRDGQAREFLRRLRPQCVADLAVAFALCRPAPRIFGLDEAFLRGRADPAAVKYLHPALDLVLKDSFGVFVWRDQAESVAMGVAGFSPDEAAEVRRALGRKKHAECSAWRERFIEDAAEFDFDAGEAEAIFAELMEYAPLTFGRRHAVARAEAAHGEARRCLGQEGMQEK